MDFIKKTKGPNDLILETSLQGFFFDELQNLNKKSTNPLSQETIYYSWRVMDKYSLSNKYYEIQDGKVREKTLGLKLLESSNLSLSGRKRLLCDIGDTAMFACGFFSESLNNKIIDVRYYQRLGVMAYRKLNSIEPELFDIPRFYRKLSESFQDLVSIIGMASSLMNKSINHEMLFVVTGPNDKKVKAS